MSCAALTAVRAARDIERFRTVVARSGTPGTVIDLHVDRPAVTYTVDFTPEGACGARIRLTGLTDIDIQPDQQDQQETLTDRGQHPPWATPATLGSTAAGHPRRLCVAWRGPERDHW